jgi:hypothetical protein
MFIKWRRRFALLAEFFQRSHNRKRVYWTSAVTGAENKEMGLFDVRETSPDVRAYGHTDEGL